jgi:hypothetical protein
MKDYAQFLVRRFAVPYFAKGDKEIHIVSSKAFEHIHLNQLLVDLDT